jgi:hypothetical protein
VRLRQYVTLNEVKGAISSMAPFAALRVTVFSLAVAGAAAAQAPPQTGPGYSQAPEKFSG